MAIIPSVRRRLFATSSEAARETGVVSPIAGGPPLATASTGEDTARTLLGIGVRGWCLIVALLAIAVYANSIPNGFAYDDVGVIVKGEALHSLRTLPQALASPWWPGPGGRQADLWRPLTTGAFGLQWAIWGNNAHAFHVVNLLLHAGVSVLVLLLLLEMAPLAGAVAGALLFALHPLHVEAVANIVGQAEILAAAGALGACLVFLRRRTDLRPLDILAIAGLYAVGVLAKESAIVLPALLALLDAAYALPSGWSWRQLARRRVPLYLALATVAGLVLVGRWLVLGRIADPLPPPGADALLRHGRFWSVVAVWPEYLRLLFFPLDLSADYAPNVLPVATGPTAPGVLGIALAALMAVLGVAVWRTRPLDSRTATPRLLAVGIAFFAIAILPVSNVFFLTGVLLAERTLYLPSVGLCIALAWPATILARRVPRTSAALLLIVLGLFSWRVIERNPNWATTNTVLTNLIRDHPESGRSQWILGTYFWQQGKRAQSIRAYHAALSLLGPFYPLLVDAGRDFSRMGRTREAEDLLRLAWAREPRYATAPQRLAVLRFDHHDYPGAERAALGALRAYSGDAGMNHILAQVYASEGRLGEAIAARERTIAVDHGHHWQQWYWLAQLFRQVGDANCAAEALDSARVRAPGESLPLPFLGKPAAGASSFRSGILPLRCRMPGHLRQPERRAGPKRSA